MKEFNQVGGQFVIIPGYSISHLEWDVLAVEKECEDRTEKTPSELPFGTCSLTNTSNLYYFYEYLDCLGIAEKSSCNKSY